MPKYIAFVPGQCLTHDVNYVLGVTSYVDVQPDPNADTSADFYGYTEVEYDVLDPNHVLWPEMDYAISQADREANEQAIHDYFSELHQCQIESQADRDSDND